MGFDTGTKQEGNAPQQPPDFAAGLAAYNEQVTALSVQIKSAQAELADIQSAIASAKADLQAQYKLKVTDLGNQIALLNTQLGDLQTQKDSLDSQIKEKIDTKNSISLDFTNKQKDIDTQWDAVHKSMGDVVNANQQLDLDKKALSDSQTQLILDRKAFEDYRTSIVAQITQQKVDADASTTASQKATDDATATIKAANDAQAQLELNKADLALKLQNAQPILDQAVAIQKMADDAKALSDSASKQALQNQNDANEIAVAKVAINNKNQELASREATVKAAEAKIIGGGV